MEPTTRPENRLKVTIPVNRKAAKLALSGSDPNGGGVIRNTRVKTAV
jgi:hypothetical protein